MTILQRITLILRDARDLRRLRAVVRARALLTERGYAVRPASAVAIEDAITERQIQTLKALLAASAKRVAALEEENAVLRQWQRRALA